MNEPVTLEVNRALESGDRAALEGLLVRLGREPSNDAIRFHTRARVLSALGRDSEALEAHLAALEIDPALAAAHYSAGVLLANSGREDDAIRRWEETVRLDPAHADALYNLGQAMYNRGRFQAALERWRAARVLAPKDFEIAKKLAQAHNALGQPDDADRALEDLVQLWRSSPDARVRALSDVIFDQFAVAGYPVLVHETLRPAHLDLWEITSFRASNRDGKLVLSVQLESGEYGRERGVPFLLSVRTARGYRVLEIAFDAKPPYRQLKPLALKVLEQELRVLH